MLRGITVDRRILEMELQFNIPAMFPVILAPPGIGLNSQ